MLADIVSKNGNLLLNIPVRGDGTIDEDEWRSSRASPAWMAVNSEAIFGTRPWKVFGEGPASAGAALTAQGFNEGKGRPFTAEDVRFTSRRDALYAICLGWPTAPVAIRSLGRSGGLLDRPIARIDLLGAAAPVAWRQTDERGRDRAAPAAGLAASPAAVYRITFK